MVAVVNSGVGVCWDTKQGAFKFEALWSESSRNSGIRAKTSRCAVWGSVLGFGDNYLVMGSSYGLRFVIVLDSILKVFIIRTYVFPKSKPLGRKGVYKRRKDSPGIYI